MFLAIDLSGDGVWLAWYRGGEWHTVSYPYDSEGALLRSIGILLNTESVQLADVMGIAVRVSKGKFTATRIAVTVANTLAYSLHIPVVAYKEFDGPNLIKMLQEAQPDLYVSAEYSAEARIGPPAKTHPSV